MKEFHDLKVVIVGQIAHQYHLDSSVVEVWPFIIFYEQIDSLLATEKG